VWPVDETVCIRLANEVGLPTAQFAALLSDPQADEQLAATAREAYTRGAFGVPTFFVGNQMFWGNDRIVILKHVLSNHHDKAATA
jgi:2-hydroxychromene-2-carboxylate isomerase